MRKIRTIRPWITKTPRAAAGVLAAVLLAGFMGGCAAAPSAASGAGAPAAPESAASGTANAAPETLLLAAAASLETVFAGRLIPAFTAQHPEITVTGTYGASGRLQTQIEEGLMADVFISAAEAQMNALADGGFIDPASVTALLQNEIVLIAPADSTTEAVSFETIDKASMIALGDPDSVPAGQYAREALTSLGMWDAIQDRVSFGQDVTEVLNQVAEGSAEVGVVYATDAAQMPEAVKVLAAAPPGSLSTKIVYPAGILAASPGRSAAELFLAFLQSPEAAAAFTEAGFTVISAQ